MVGSAQLILNWVRLASLQLDSIWQVLHRLTDEEEDPKRQQLQVGAQRLGKTHISQLELIKAHPGSPSGAL